MINKKDINWYLENPQRLLSKKPFIRGGELSDRNCYGGNITLSSKSDVKLSTLQFHEISQDTYLEEYDPSLHRIKFNKSIPNIAVKVGDRSIEIDDMVLCAAYQKNIHAAHVLHLTAQDMEFTLCNTPENKKKNLFTKIATAITGNQSNDNGSDITQKFQKLKQEWLYRDMKSVMNEVVSKQQKTGDVGLLFMYDKKTNKGSFKVYSYDEGYIIIPNYNEYGEQISCSLYYKTDDNTQVIDTYDDTYHYRMYQSNDPTDPISENGWVYEQEVHGYPKCPLLYKRGKVAWEYAESTIEMWELMANINAVALKRFGTFGLVLIGAMDKNSFKRDSSTLVINLSSDTSNGKQDAKVLEFPEPQKMLEYLDFLKTEIATFSSVSFITPKDITSTGSGGNGIFLAMKNDLALATQSVSDWSPFTNDMVYLFQSMLSLESKNTNEYNDLKISAKLKPWTMESDTTKITNLAMESKWLSKQSIVEKSPDAAPDEMERLSYESEDLQLQQQESDSLTAEKISKNNNPAIQNQTNKTTYSNVASK